MNDYEKFSDWLKKQKPEEQYVNLYTEREVYMVGNVMVSETTFTPWNWLVDPTITTYIHLQFTHEQTLLFSVNLNRVNAIYAEDNIYTYEFNGVKSLNEAYNFLMVNKDLINSFNGIPFVDKNQLVLI